VGEPRCSLLGALPASFFACLLRRSPVLAAWCTVHTVASSTRSSRTRRRPTRSSHAPMRSKRRRPPSVFPCPPHVSSSPPRPPLPLHGLRRRRGLLLALPSSRALHLSHRRRLTSPGQPISHTGVARAQRWTCTRGVPRHSQLAHATRGGRSVPLVSPRACPAFCRCFPSAVNRFVTFACAIHAFLLPAF